MDLSNTNWTKAQGIKINECLAKVLASPMFAKAERQQRFLSYIMAETLEGRAEKLKGYNIGVEVFDRDPSFDPAIDAIVRVEASRLRSKLREYYDGAGCTDPVRFELPKGTYAIRMEWQGEGTTQAQNSGAATNPQLIEDRPSLAVLPFANMSSDRKQGYFADGITECLITEISRLEGLLVISRHSSFVYKGVSKRAEEIGSELGVRYLLEGSVQRAGSSVRITAQLIDVNTGTHVWAEHYDRELKDIFAVQDEVTHSIANILHIKLTAGEGKQNQHAGISSMEAHDSLLRGLEHFLIFTQVSTEEARVHFANAVKIDPGSSSAHAWLARTLVFLWVFFWDTQDETLELAFRHAQMAIELDPKNPFAHSVLCWVQCWRREGDASIAAGRRAVALDSNNADAYLFLSFTLVAKGHGREALSYIETGMRLNPHPSAFYQFVLGLCHFELEEYGEAIEAFRLGIEAREVFIPNHVWLCVVYTLLDREEEARIQRDRVLLITGGHIPVVRQLWLDESLESRMSGLMRLAGLA